MGSRARGGYTEDSDYDLLVVVGVIAGEPLWRLRWAVRKRVSRG